MNLEWVSLFLPALVITLILFVPGLLISIAMGQKGIGALGIAPAISVAVVAMSGILAAKLGINWSLLVPLCFAVVLAVIAWVLTHFLGTRNTIFDFPASDQRSLEIRNQRWFSSEMGWVYASLIIGLILQARNITNAIGNPNWISQTYDANFHLNAIRWIADTGNASSLDILSMTSGGSEPEFYPAAWHAVGALSFMTTGASVPQVANAMSLVVGSVVLPVSLMYLVLQVAQLTRTAILSIGAISAAFVGFQLLLINFGVLYPNSLGMAMIPAGLAVVAQLFRTVQVADLQTVPAVFIGILVALGIAFAHPNAIMALLVIMLPIIGVRIILQIASAFRHQTPPLVAVVQVVLLGLIPFAVYILWGIVRPDKEQGGWGWAVSRSQALGEAVGNGPLWMNPAWFITLIMVIGIFSLFVRLDRTIWLFITWCVAVYFYIVVRSYTWEEDRDWLVGVWYHDPYRLAALLPLVAMPLCVVGIDYIADKIRRTKLVKGTSAKLLFSSGVAVTASAVLALVVVIYCTQSSKPLKQYVSDTFWSYAPSAETPLLTLDEIEVLEHIDDYVPESETVVVQPWTGGAMAYAVSGRHITAYHTLFQESPEEKIINEGLNKADQDPQVCEALESINAEYFLDFGTQEIIEQIHGKHTEEFIGLQDVQDSGVVESVYTVGEVGLYKITSCS